MTDEHDRIEAAKALAGWYFNLVTLSQRTAFNTAMMAARGYTGPRWDRARKAAHTNWDRDTAAARALYHVTLAEILETGEVSQALSYRWDELTARAAEVAA